MNVLFLNWSTQRQKWFCGNVCICMFKWDLICIVPSTINGNDVGFEMKLWLQNICGIFSMPIKKYAWGTFFLSFFLIPQILLKSKNRVDWFSFFFFACISCLYHSTFEHQIVSNHISFVIIIITIIMAAHTYRILTRCQAMCQVVYMSYSFTLL